MALHGHSATKSLANDAFAKFNHAIVMAHYTEALDAGEAPNINMIAIWQGAEYHIGGVRQQVRHPRELCWLCPSLQ